MADVKVFEDKQRNRHRDKQTDRAKTICPSSIYIDTDNLLRVFKSRECVVKS